MNTIEIRSMSASHIIRDMADNLDTKFEKICEEFTLHLPSKVGTGYVTGIDTIDGLGVLLYDCSFKEDTEIRFIV